MKKCLLITLTVLIGFPLLAQEEVHLPPAILAAGGSTNGSAASLSLARWRLSRVHVITLSEEVYSREANPALLDSGEEWFVTMYPNPVNESLYIEFELSEARDFIIHLTDLTGRILMVEEARTIQPDEIIELNLSRFSPALYLLHISTPDQETHKIFRTQKI